MVVYDGGMKRVSTCDGEKSSKMISHIQDNSDISNVPHAVKKWEMEQNWRKISSLSKIYEIIILIMNHNAYLWLSLQ